MTNTELTGGRIATLMRRYVVPTTLGMFTVSLYILADTVIVGRAMGAVGLAALNISIPLFNLFFGTGLAFGVGAATAIGVSAGRGNVGIVQPLYRHAIVGALTVGTLYTAVGHIHLESLIHVMGATPTTHGMVRDYVSTVVTFSAVFVLVYTLVPLVRNDGAPRLAMAGMMIGGILNIILDVLFVVVLDAGMRGAALATTLSACVSAAILVPHAAIRVGIGRRHAEVTADPRPSPAVTLPRILANGTAGFVTEVSSGVVIFLFNITILRVADEVDVAAYGIVANVTLVCVALFTGIAQGTQPLVSAGFGAGFHRRTHRIFVVAAAAAATVGAAVAAVGLIAPTTMARAFTEADPALIVATQRGIRNVFPAFPVMAFNIVAAGFLQAQERAASSAAIAAGRGVVVVVPILLFFARWWGLSGVWLTIPVVELTVGIPALMVVFTSFRGAQTMPSNADQERDTRR